MTFDRNSTLAEIAAHNARIHQQNRERRGLGELTESRAETVNTRNKYGNVKTADGYASRKEAKRAIELRLLEKSGAIRDLKEQIRFLLIPKQEGERAAFYKADFSYEENVNGAWIKVVEDTKSEITKTQAYILRRKLMQFVHHIRIRET